MPEKASLPVTVTRSPGEITVEMYPQDITGFKREGDQVTRVKLALAGEIIAVFAVLLKTTGGSAMPDPLPGLTDEEASAFIESIQEDHDRTALRARIEDALDGSIDRCYRCKVCDVQVDAVMAALGYPPGNASYTERRTA